MTAEVLIMNKDAVAIAADSAGTVAGGGGDRYFKGSEKIFQLSDHEPVGVMINGASELCGVPWAILIRNYREKLSATSFGTLKEYRDDFLQFVKDHSLLERGVSKGDIDQFLFDALKGIDEELSRGVSIDEIIEFLKKMTDDQKKEIDALGIEYLDIESLKENYSESANKLVQEIRSAGALEESTEAFNDNNLQELIIIFSLYEAIIMEHSISGLVFTGFGKEEYFPSFIEVQFIGYLSSIFECKDKKKASIDRSSGAWIESFAMDSMIDTFKSGYSEDTFSDVKHEFINVLDSYYTELRPYLNESGFNHPAIRSDIINYYQYKLTKLSRDKHFRPLLNVIRNLPINEMAEFAETLINIESLKERMTKSSESVSGPIDVAVITKFGGFIWIKRKHFFEPELNPRFFKRINT